MELTQEIAVGLVIDELTNTVTGRIGGEDSVTRELTGYISRESVEVSSTLSIRHDLQIEYLEAHPTEILSTGEFGVRIIDSEDDTYVGTYAWDLEKLSLVKR